MLLSGFFAVIWVSVKNKTLAEVIRNVGTITEHLYSCMIFIFIDWNQLIEIMVAILLLYSRLNNVPAQLAGCFFALHLYDTFLCCDFGYNTEICIATEDTGFAVAAFFESDSDRVIS